MNYIVGWKVKIFCMIKCIIVIEYKNWNGNFGYFLF